MGIPSALISSLLINPVVDEQGNNTETARYTSGVTNTFGQVKDLVPAAQGSAAELLEIAGSGIKGSINQTRHAGEYAGPRDDETGAGQDSTTLDEKEDSGIKGRMIELAEIAGLGLKSSINQTLHADEYPSLTTRDLAIITEPFHEEETRSLHQISSVSRMPASSGIFSSLLTLPPGPLREASGIIQHQIHQSGQTARLMT